jgi:uncharacterized protein YciI
VWYAVMSSDFPNSLGKRMAARPAHVARLVALRDEGRLLIAGPHPAVDATDPGPAGFTGSLVVVDFPTLESAQDWANEDPYLAAGVYEKVVVKPFNLVLP